VNAPVTRYANLSPAACNAELAKRKLPFKPAPGPAKGVATPLYVSGPIEGVQFVTPGKRSVYGKLDCRLALSLADMAHVLAEHDVVRVGVDNLYRPKAHLPGKRKPSQHAYGLALDVAFFTLSDGRTLTVERDFGGSIGEPVCGPESNIAEGAKSDEAVLLRNLVCAIAGARIFHHVLTPNYNAAHENHLHLDLKRDDVKIVVE
jgi:hypothetical protein